MLSSLMNYFRSGHASRQKRPAGNRAAPPYVQQDIIAAARVRRERKLNRPQGWYNG